MSCNSLELYDKCNNLIGYAEFKNVDGEIKCFYSVNGSTLNRKYMNEYPDEPSEIVSSVIEYSDNIMLYPLNVGGETVIRTIQSGETFTSFNSPAILSRMDVYDEDSFKEPEVQSFSVNSNLIDEWLNKV